jgi:hypothetical protein
MIKKATTESKEWRPENWKNPYSPDLGGCQHAAIYEAGASAMLDALRRMGDRKHHKDWGHLINNLPTIVDDDGITVFIPDDE